MVSGVLEAADGANIAGQIRRVGPVEPRQVTFSVFACRPISPRRRGARLPINKPDRALHPEGFLGIATVYKKFCLRPICQHVVHLKKPFFLVRPERDPPPGQRQASVPSKIFRSDVVLVNARAHKHRPHAGNHGGRSGTVIDRALQCGQMPGQHLLVDHNGLALPFFLRF
jgi:hypothetical protein